MRPAITYNFSFVIFLLIIEVSNERIVTCKKLT